MKWYEDNSNFKRTTAELNKLYGYKQNYKFELVEFKPAFHKKTYYSVNISCRTPEVSLKYLAKNTHFMNVQYDKYWFVNFSASRIDIVFEKLEDAQEWCENFADFLKNKTFMPSSDPDNIMGARVYFRDKKFGFVRFQGIDTEGKERLLVQLYEPKKELVEFNRASVLRVERVD